MALKFGHNKQEGKAIVKELAEQLGCSWNTDRAERTLKAVLIALRNRLDIKDAALFFDQLPMSLKIVYADGWKINAKTPEQLTGFIDLFNEIQRVDKRSAVQDFTNPDMTRMAIIAVFKAISGYVKPAAMEQMTDILPEEVQEFVLESMPFRKAVVA